MNDLAGIIRREIDAAGVISFARFMELALYCPERGYYERLPQHIGRQGDFFTSVSVGSVFGELLAFQFAEWLQALGQPGGTEPDPGSGLKAVSGNANDSHLKFFRLLECGAHDGRLAADILQWFTNSRPDLLSLVQYCILEPSSSRRAWQQRTLASFAPQVQWIESWSVLGAQSVRGVIFSNELLDAFPVHHLSWDAGLQGWFEWGVGCEGGRFIWKRLPNPSELAPGLPLSLLKVLPDGFTTEVSPAAKSWWEQAARALQSGLLLTLDYGLTAEEFFLPERSRGTLRSFSRHRASNDLLAHPGEQDLTAHVNFSALQIAGESAGLSTREFNSQAQFLTRVFEKTLKPDSGFAPWTPEHLRQFKTLTHPEHLGRPFRVLVQARNMP